MAKAQAGIEKPRPPADALGRARERLEAGDVRAARKLLADAAGEGPDERRAVIARLAEGLAPDWTALAAAGGVLLLGLLAALLGLRAH